MASANVALPLHHHAAETPRRRTARLTVGDGHPHRPMRRKLTDDNWRKTSLKRWMHGRPQVHAWIRRLCSTIAPRRRSSCEAAARTSTKSRNRTDGMRASRRPLMYLPVRPVRARLGSRNDPSEPLSWDRRRAAVKAEQAAEQQRRAQTEAGIGHAGGKRPNEGKTAAELGPARFDTDDSRRIDFSDVMGRLPFLEHLRPPCRLAQACGCRDPGVGLSG